nr:hypothetical protein [Shewanella profunda]
MKTQLMVVMAGVFLLSGCSAFFNGNTTEKNAVSSSLVEYLYPV